MDGIRKTTLGKDLYVKPRPRPQLNKPKVEFVSGVQKPERNNLVFFEGSSYNFDLEDLLRASAEVLGKVSYGSSYKTTLLLEEATTVVVLRLKKIVVGKKEFEQHMEILERVGQHTNVAKWWVYSVVREKWIAEVYDVELMRYQNVEEGMLQMLQIAMDCVSKRPDARPNMVKVVRMIEEIRLSDSERRLSSEENKSKDTNVQTP
ncbi:putative inactive receptor kinase [Trifolium repens]|nr:putative inactive receptor kinase [Trifolium repens]